MAVQAHSSLVFTPNQSMHNSWTKFKILILNSGNRFSFNRVLFIELKVWKDKIEPGHLWIISAYFLLARNSKSSILTAISYMLLLVQFRICVARLIFLDKIHIFFASRPLFLNLGNNSSISFFREYVSRAKCESIKWKALGYVQAWMCLPRSCDLWNSKVISSVYWFVNVKIN